MSVFLPPDCRTWRYDFRFRGKRYVGSTGMSRKDDAERWERQERVRLERQAGDLALRAQETPRFQDWAETFYEHKTTRRPLKRPDLLEREIRVVLEFCGAPPRPRAAAPGRRPPRRHSPAVAPYRDLRLGDFIEQPELITEFERWLRARKTGGSARNHYRSVMSGMYRVAMLPEFRRLTGIRANPFLGIERDPQTRRRVTQTVAELRAWVEHASPHIRAALAIGALAPALRLGSILALEWDRHVDSSLRFITVTDRKADQTNPEPLVIPITGQLRAILQAARERWTVLKAKNPKLSAHVVQYRGRRVKSIKNGLRAAARRAGIAYGIAGGVTFHTLRHTMATMLAELGVPEGHRKALLDHASIETTQIYTHLRPMYLSEPLALLAGEVGLEDVIRAAPKIPKRGKSKRLPVDNHKAIT